MPLPAHRDIHQRLEAQEAGHIYPLARGRKGKECARAFQELRTTIRGWRSTWNGLRYAQKHGEKTLPLLSDFHPAGALLSRPVKDPVRNR